MSENKRFTTWGNRIKRNGKLLNINFETKTDAKLCCKLCNQMDKDNQEYIDELDEIFKWYKEYYGETILDTKMGWNEDNKISKLKKENEQLKQTIKTIKEICNQYKIPTCLATYIPVNCEKRKGCLDNHMTNANNMGKSNLAKEILELI